MLPISNVNLSQVQDLKDQAQLKSLISKLSNELDSASTREAKEKIAGQLQSLAASSGESLSSLGASSSTVSSIFSPAAALKPVQKQAVAEQPAVQKQAVVEQPAVQKPAVQKQAAAEQPVEQQKAQAAPVEAKSLKEQMASLTRKEINDITGCTCGGTCSNCRKKLAAHFGASTNDVQAARKLAASKGEAAIGEGTYKASVRGGAVAENINLNADEQNVLTDVKQMIKQGDSIGLTFGEIQKNLKAEGVDAKVSTVKNADGKDVQVLSYGKMKIVDTNGDGAIDEIEMGIGDRGMSEAAYAAKEAGNTKEAQRLTAGGAATTPQTQVAAATPQTEVAQAPAKAAEAKALVEKQAAPLLDQVQAPQQTSDTELKNLLAKILQLVGSVK